MPALHLHRSRARRLGAFAAVLAGLALGSLGSPGSPGSPAAAGAGMPVGGGSTPERGATAPQPDEPAGIDVVQVQGLLDPPNASLIEDAIERAERRDSTLLLFQIDSGGAVDTDVEHLADLIATAEVPVAVWVGPSGADAQGGAAVLALSAPYVAVAQGAGIGPADPVRLDRPDRPGRTELEADLRARQESFGRDPGGVDDVVRGRVGAAGVSDLGLVDATRPTLGEVIVGLDGETIETAAGPQKLSTAEVVGVGENRRRQPDQEVRFSKLDLAGQLAHSLGRPWVAYLLFVTGAALIVLEFFTVGVGLAGLTGALSLVGGCYGFSYLPVQWWAAGLLLAGLAGLAVDLQAGGVGVWTGLGTAALVAGSIWLYGGSSRLDPPWWSIALVVVLTLVFMIGGMPAMVRSRFSTPTIGREDLIGEAGRAEVAIAPDGVVRVRDALWRARTNRATPIGAGDPVRVVAVEGVVLEVEPGGGDRDHGDRDHGDRDHGGRTGRR